MIAFMYRSRSSRIVNLLSAFKFAILMAAALVLASCNQTIFESRDPELSNGLAYYLPKTLVKVKVTPVGYDSSTPVAELSEEERGAAGTKGLIRSRVPIDRATYSVLVNDKGELANTLITGLEISIEDYDPDSNTADDEIPYKQIADTARYQTLRYNSSVRSTDKVCAGTTKDSLLNYVQSSTKDETGNIVIAAGKIAGRVAGQVGFATSSNSEPASKLAKLAFSVEIDPLNSNDWTTVEAGINAHFPSMRGRYKFHAPDYKNLLPDHYGETCPLNTICYRTLVPQRLVLTDKRSHKDSVTYAKVANRRIMNKVEVTRAFLVEKVTKLNFDSGVLTEIIVRKDSEALALAKLPLTLYDTILTALLSAPGKFLGQITPIVAGPQDLKNKIIDPFKDQITTVNAIRAQLEGIRNADFDNKSVGAVTLNCS